MLLCCEFWGSCCVVGFGKVVVLWRSGEGWHLRATVRENCCVVSSGEVVVLWVSGKLLCCGLWGKGGTYGPPYD